ncbi:TPA: exopolysaccharide biosynthesis protein [Streptococcus pneumoniae]|nr:exopolysaccharide biosynthesis protein [Streptococcus pneumoniae]HET5054483.1 exopolysaccharide biosynthesis protein [Streptococcus pneumoniae]HET5058349.1 exopolysaccharide biosynthesis protein [Streptococcus pneumoniae]
MIPKKIHYCWFGGKPLSNDVKRCIASWKKFCPDYEIIEWTEKNFCIENQNQFVQDAYRDKAWAFVSDYARLKIIYENGGIYLDTDVEVIKNLDKLLENKAFFGVHQVNHLVNTGLGFGSEKGTSILKELLNLYDEIEFDLSKKDELLCPELNTPVFKRLDYTYSDCVVKNEYFTIYPEEYFDPISLGDGVENILSDKTFSIHHYSASWTSLRNQMKSKIIRKLGRSNILELKRILKGKTR